MTQALTKPQPRMIFQWWRKRRKRDFWFKLIIYALLLCLGLLFMVPFLFMLSSSLKDPQQVWQVPPSWVPNPVFWQNYPYALAQMPFFGYFRNTVLLVIGVEIGRLLTASMTAYAFARLRFRWRMPLFILVLSTMMIPYQVTLIPQFLIFKELHWLNSLKPLIVPAFFGGGAFYVFLLRQFFMTIPLDYDDAARIDGASYLDIFLRVILPLSMPVLGTVAIFTFMEQWNDLLGPLIYLNTADKQTLSIGIAMWSKGGAYPAVHFFSHTMAIALLMSLPPVVIFFIFQRHFIQGVVISGVKG